MIMRVCAILLGLLAIPLPSFCQQSQVLDHATRAQYQRAIEEVYWHHRIWPAGNPGAKPALGSMISVEQMQARADDAPRLSSALEKYWNTRISGEELQAEIVRMTKSTRQPEVLSELFAALDNDPRLIAEMLARPALAERLARGFYEVDSRFNARTQSFDSWWDRARSQFDAPAAEPAFAYVIPDIDVTPAVGDSWTPTFALPNGSDNMTAVWTGSEMIVWGGSIAGRFNSGSRYNPATDTWHPTNASSAPDGKAQHTAVWTGTEMIVWGGCDHSQSEHSCQSNLGGRYNPATDSWVPTASAGAPNPRISHTAVWTGTEMIVWGGCAFINDACRASQVTTGGGRYNPSTDSWSPTNTANAPDARYTHTAVWTGNQMIVWGGWNDSTAVSTGGVYIPGTDTWTATAIVPASFGRFSHSAVWTGREMIVWGGANGTAVFNNGARYSPTLNRWKAVPVTGAPTPRSSHAAVWTGAEMIVWGGVNGFAVTSTGGRYNPATNAWKATSTTNAPVGRSGKPAGVWTGKLMIVWGGFDRTGGRYNPASDSWTPTNAKEAPIGRENHTSVWTGTEMIVWGGSSGVSLGENSGGRYNLATDSWAPTSRVGAPSGRNFHTAVWSGTEMIVWGGATGNTAFKTGGRYNPISDSWKKINVTGAPEARTAHAAIWTGTEMIAFGGSGQIHTWLNTGGRYNPSTDSWTTTSVVNAPSARELPAVVWTGTEMIVWGGGGATFDTKTGGRYNPSSDAWTATSLVNAPSPRNWTASLWTGSKMLIWGGQTYDGTYTYHNDGALYDPANDSWTATSQTGAPSIRAWFGYVWTGNEFIAWGGGCSISPQSGCPGQSFTGGRYNPATDMWIATATATAPAARSMFPAIWTGSKMIVWGGSQSTSFLTGSGGVYTPGQ
jgi:N-acetylneuraminic acid mutarotase